MIRSVLVIAAVGSADVGTTLVGLSRGAHEAMPAARAALEGGGVAGLLALSIVGLAAQALVLAAMPRRFRRAGVLVTVLLGMVPVVSNVAVLTGGR